jgi:hypothetical protein
VGRLLELLTSINGGNNDGNIFRGDVSRILRKGDGSICERCRDAD